jgi:hypothetical protein
MACRQPHKLVPACVKERSRGDSERSDALVNCFITRVFAVPWPTKSYCSAISILS